MNPVFTFILGLLIGWLIEWLIDYFYWRRRYAEKETVHSHDTESVRRASSMGDKRTQAPTKVARDDLKVIKGIGPVIERKLNEADIYTFEQLGNLTTAQLRRILGDMVERLSDEESLLLQARDLARRK